MITTRSSPGSTVAPTDPRSTSPALSSCQFAGAKYDRTVCRSGDSWRAESLYPKPEPNELPVTTYTLPSGPTVGPDGAQMLAPRAAGTLNTKEGPPPRGTPTTYPR